MQLTRILIAANLFLSCALAQSGADAKTIYFLEDESHMQWCGYANESRFKAQVQSLMAMVIGGADYTSGRLSTIHVTEADQTGDWAVNDEYTLGVDGRIRSLKRTINIIPEDNSEEQLFVVKNGKAIKQRSVHRELQTGRPTKNTVNWFHASPVITEIKAFPFSALITEKQEDVRSAAEVCIPDRAK